MVVLPSLSAISLLSCIVKIPRLVSLKEKMAFKEKLKIFFYTFCGIYLSTVKDWHYRVEGIGLCPSS